MLKNIMNKKSGARTSKKKNNSILEFGDIYFFYRPKVKSIKENVAVHGFHDIQRFYVVLHPQRSKLHRLIILGAKRLPEIREKPEKNWAMIDLVTKSKRELLKELHEHYYRTKTRGERYLPDSRPVGEGVYSISEQGRNTYLSYSLELPESPGETQLDLKIEPQASYVISAKNPSKPGKRAPAKPKLPSNLKKVFEDLRFIPVKSTKLLNYSNMELIIIGAHTDTKDASLSANQENINTADIFTELNYWRKHHTIVPLIKGKWL